MDAATGAEEGDDGAAMQQQRMHDIAIAAGVVATICFALQYVYLFFLS